MYFDQQTGAPHAVCGRNQIFDAKTTFCIPLSHKMYKIKHCLFTGQWYTKGYGTITDVI